MFHLTCSAESNPGGTKSGMSDMFAAFVEFNVERLESANLQRAVALVILFFCEARRLRSMERCMSSIIERRSEPDELSDQQWERIRSWKRSGTEVVNATKCHLLDEKKKETYSNPLPSTFNRAGPTTYEDLVGYDGELLIMKLCVDYLGWDEKKMKRHKTFARRIPNVEFEDHP